MYPDDVILNKARLKGIPVISVNDDTLTSIEKIEAMSGKVGIGEEKKVARVRELMGDFDYKGLLKALNL